MKKLIATPLALGAMLLASVPLGSMVPAYASTRAAKAATDGWVRLANLSPTTGTCDLYLYSFGNPKALIVLQDVNYGGVSGYSALPAGDYTVAMRMSGQSANSPAVASTVLMLMGNMEYTVAAMGILQAASGTTVSADVGQQQVGSDLKFGDITHYQTVAPGTHLVSLNTSAGQASVNVPLSANSTHTLVVLDGSTGPAISDLTDAVGDTVRPSGGAATGFGGTAPRPLSSPLPWLAMIGGGALAAVLGRRRGILRTSR
jgi:hypothetical protein